ncbi:sgmD [Symbiodinium natans]|uniref:SgmD protein n=1 Tax=Symbiodinium natans TaxID=878477 RepID=A0A812IYK5_9DINO|nr:sgmD [Symbiodinium natans]
MIRNAMSGNLISRCLLKPPRAQDLCNMYTFAQLLRTACLASLASSGTGSGAGGAESKSCSVEDADAYLQLLQLDLALRSRSSDVESFLWLTDAHVDPYYLSPDRQCFKMPLSRLTHFPFGMIGCDPPPHLLYSVLEGAAAWLKSGGNSSFVLFTGDFVRHHLLRMQNSGANASDIVKNVSVLTRNYFADIPAVFGALGNSDSHCDYCQEITTDRPVNPWFWTLGNAINQAGCMTNKTLEAYKYGGYFELAVGGLTILSISTVIYSVFHVPAGPLEDDPFSQFAWLKERLGEAVQQQRRVWIVGHIPPGIETFGFTELWRPVYVAKYLEIVQDPVLGPAIAAQLFGHLHKDEFRVLPNPPPGAGPIILSASISPVYYNNPSFKIVQYNRTSGKLVNFKMVYSEITADGKPLQWGFGYDLLQTYPEFQGSGLSMDAVMNLTDEFSTGLESWKQYARWYAASYPNELQHYTALKTDSEANATWKSKQRRQYTCAMVIRTAAEYQDCLGVPALAGSMTSMSMASMASRDEIERLLLGKLLSWASVSTLSTANVVLKLAAREDWGKLLALFGDLVEWSLRAGKPLESVFSDFA